MKKILAIAALLASSVTFASEIPPAMMTIIKSGIEVVNKFEAPAGLTGWAVKNGGEDNIIYTTEDGQHILVGAMLDVNGQNLTGAHKEKYFPAPDFNEFWSKLENESAYVKEGSSDAEAKSVVYVFMEPNCTYCNLVWKAMKPYTEEGLQVRHVVVSFLRQDSAAKAAAILEADDPVAKITELGENFKSGGIEGKKNPSAKTLSAIQKNNSLMRAMGVKGTPALVYQSTDGETLLSKGMPRLRDLSDIIGLPYIESKDPSLTRFR